MRKIFIVEDDRFITAIFTMFLRDLGHELIGKTGSGKEAVEMCRELKPDIVLMDIHLEGELDGIQTAEMLKREIEVPIVYISSDTTSHVIERAIVSNSYGYLVKPINKKELGISIDLAYYKHKVDLEQKQREQGYREFISDSPLPIVVLIDDKISYLNKLGMDVFKTHYIEDVIGLPVNNFIHDESKDEFFNKVESGFNHDKRIKPFIAKMLDVHGNFYWAEITGSKVHFNNRQSVQLIFKNISSEQMNIKKMNLLQEILLADDRICLHLDHNLNVLRSNLFSHEKLGVDTLIGKKIDDILTFSNPVNEVVNNMDDLSTKEISVNLGGNKYLDLSVYVVKSFSGTVSEVIMVEKLKS